MLFPWFGVPLPKLYLPPLPPSHHVFNCYQGSFVPDTRQILMPTCVLMTSWFLLSQTLAPVCVPHWAGLPLCSQYTERVLIQSLTNSVCWMNLQGNTDKYTELTHLRSHQLLEKGQYNLKTWQLDRQWSLVVRRTGSQGKQTGVWILAQLFVSWVTLGILCNLSELHFSGNWE